MRMLRVALVLLVLAAFLCATAAVSAAQVPTAPVKGIKVPTITPAKGPVNITPKAPAMRLTITPMPPVKTGKLLDLAPMRSTVQQMSRNLKWGELPGWTGNKDASKAVKGEAAEIALKASQNFVLGSGKTSGKLGTPAMRPLPAEMQGSGLLPKMSGKKAVIPKAPAKMEKIAFGL